MKTILLLFISVLGIHTSFGQQKTKSPEKSEAPGWKFNTIMNVGLLNGEAGSAFQVQMINGFTNRSWFAGIGVGIDYYKFRSIPLFFDLRKEFGKTPNRLFVYGDAGINFGWATSNEKTAYVMDDKIGNGFYSDLGVGYKIRISHADNLLISLGYSYKKMVETYNSYYYVPSIYPGFVPPATMNQSEINYSMNRISIKLGWVF